MILCYEPKSYTSNKLIDETSDVSGIDYRNWNLLLQVVFNLRPFVQQPFSYNGAEWTYDWSPKLWPLQSPPQSPDQNSCAWYLTHRGASTFPICLSPHHLCPFDHLHSMAPDTLADLHCLPLLTKHAWCGPSVSSPGHAWLFSHNIWSR